MGPKARCGPGHGAVERSRARVLWYGGSNSTRYPVQGASEPSWRLAPRLDRRERSLPWVLPHFIIFLGHRNRRCGRSERVVVCSKAVNGGSRPLIHNVVIAVTPVRTRLGVGVGSRRAVGIEPAPAGASVAVNSIGVIGNAVTSRRQRQLTSPRRARVSAQLVRAQFFRSGCAIGRAVMSPLGCCMNSPAGVFAAWRAVWRYDGCWTGKHAIGSDVGGGDGNV
jgi:hypothetical protein